MSRPIEKSIWIDAERSVVFDYFVDGDKMSQWCGVSARLDPRPGGVHQLDMGAGGVFVGRFLQVEKPTQIVYEIDMPPGVDGPPSTVTITLSDEARGTRVHILHSGLPDPFPSIATCGWDHHLARLSVVATGGRVGEDSLCVRPVTPQGWA